MKKLSRLCAAALSAAMLLSACAASRLRLGAAAEGGVDNAFGTALGAQISNIEVKQTAGSAANLRLLAGGYLQLAVAQSDMAQDAYNGTGIFTHESTERSFSAVAALYDEPVQVVVRADSGITTLEEAVRSTPCSLRLALGPTYCKRLPPTAASACCPWTRVSAHGC